jgi:hypothetical protein
MVVTEEVPVFSVQDLQAEIRLLENNLRTATERLHVIQNIIGTTTPEVHVINQPPASLPEEVYVRTVNLDGFCPDDRVKVEWDRFFKFGRSFKHMRRTESEGQLATVTRVTAKFVWIVMVNSPNGTPHQKANHNVSLQTPALGAERVLIIAKDHSERRVDRRRPGIDVNRG